MPWDGTELWVAELAGDGSVSGERLVAGGPDESILQPLWSPTGELWFASDRTGWYNLYAVAVGAGGGSSGGKPQPCPLEAREAEFAAVPWVFGLQQYVFLADGRVVVCFTEDGSDRLAILDAPADGGAVAAHKATTLRDLGSPYSAVNSLAPLGARVGLIGATHTEGSQIVMVDPGNGTAGGPATFDVVRRGRRVPIDPAYISRPEAIVFPTEGGLTAHANYYPPANPDFRAPEGELPPLLVIVHGGPTSSHEAKLDLDVQYWTSRGIAVVDVNYGGSTGYGREYRERLKGEWGVVDTVDSINAAKYLIARGDADPARVGVRGGSAGGYTTLNALTRHDFFTAGASLFGLADLESFATGGTHKFESQYLDSLVGPYPERRDVYRDRSPIHHVDEIDCPVILLQGLEDAIVPHAAGRRHRRGPAPQGPALRLPAVRGRAARVPQGGEHHPRGGGRAVLLRARVGVRAGRRDRAGRDREPGLTRAAGGRRLPANRRRSFEAGNNVVQKGGGAGQIEPRQDPALSDSRSGPHDRTRTIHRRRPRRRGRQRGALRADGRRPDQPARRGGRGRGRRAARRVLARRHPRGRARRTVGRQHRREPPAGGAAGPAAARPSRRPGGAPARRRARPSPATQARARASSSPATASSSPTATSPTAPTSSW